MLESGFDWVGWGFSRAVRGQRADTALQAAEKLVSVKGTGFRPYISAMESTGALAPEGYFSGNSLTPTWRTTTRCSPWKSSAASPTNTASPASSTPSPSQASTAQVNTTTGP